MVHYWDKLGVLCMEHLSSFEVSLLRIQINRDLTQHHKIRKAFSGQLTWDGASIDRNSTVYSVAQEKTGKPLVNNSETSWSIQHGRLAISLATNLQQVVVALVYLDFRIVHH
jgi:hypothetical protein